MKDKKVDISKKAKEETKKEKGYFYTDKAVNQILAIIGEAPGKFAIPVHDIIRSGKETEL